VLNEGVVVLILSVRLSVLLGKLKNYRSEIDITSVGRTNLQMRLYRLDKERYACCIVSGDENIDGLACA